MVGRIHSVDVGVSRGVKMNGEFVLWSSYYLEQYQVKSVHAILKKDGGAPAELYTIPH